MEFEATSDDSLWLSLEEAPEEPLRIVEEGGDRVRERLSLTATDEGCGGLVCWYIGLSLLVVVDGRMIVETKHEIQDQDSQVGWMRLGMFSNSSGWPPLSNMWTSSSISGFSRFNQPHHRLHGGALGCWRRLWEMGNFW